MTYLQLLTLTLITLTQNRMIILILQLHSIPLDERSLVSNLRQQQQMNEVTAKSLLQQQLLLSQRSSGDAMLSLPLSLGNPPSVDGSTFQTQAATEALYSSLAGPLDANAQTANQQHFQPSPPPLPPQGGSLGGAPKEGTNQAPPTSASGGSNGAGAPQKTKG
ncbi:ESX-4 secretion system protein EccC4 [Bienertia sinuspersici]